MSLAPLLLGCAKDEAGNASVNPVPGPSGGGLISFSRYAAEGTAIFTISGDGTNEQQVGPSAGMDIHSNWSADGSWLAFTEVGSGSSWICRMQANGSERQRLTPDETWSLVPSISPNGTRIAFTSDVDGNYEVYTMSMDGSDVQQLTFTDPPASHVGPKYSPDGVRILYAFKEQYSDTGQDLYLMNTDGTGAQRITWGMNNAESRSWSPDGARIVFNNVVNGVGQLFIVNSDGTGLEQLSFNPGTTPALVLGGFFPPLKGDVTPAWSPDGEWIAYGSDISGNFDIHLVRPNGSDHHQVTNTPEQELSVWWRPIP